MYMNQEITCLTGIANQEALSQWRPNSTPCEASDQFANS